MSSPPDTAQPHAARQCYTVAFVDDKEARCLRAHGHAGACVFRTHFKGFGELCQCGHDRSVHAFRDGRSDGRCAFELCNCARYVADLMDALRRVLPEEQANG